MTSWVKNRDWVGIGLIFSTLIVFSFNAGLKPTLWDEFLWLEVIQNLLQTMREGMTWEKMVHPTGWQYPPLYFLVTSLSVKLLGESWLVYRCTGILASAATIYILYREGRKHTELNPPLIALLVLAIPFYWEFGSALYVDPFQTFWITAGLAGVSSYLETEKSFFLWGYFIAVFCAVSTKYTSILLPGAVCLFCLFPWHFQNTPAHEDPHRFVVRRNLILVSLIASSISLFLFLRSEDILTVLIMKQWTSPPLEFSEFFRRVPPTLFIAGLIGLICTVRSRQSVLVLWGLFFVLWSALFISRHNIQTWYFPALPSLVLLSLVGMDRLLRPSGKTGHKPMVMGFVGLVLVFHLWASGTSLYLYRAENRIYQTAENWVNQRADRGDITLADTQQLLSPHYIFTLKMDIRDLQFNRAKYAVLTEKKEEYFRLGTFDRSEDGLANTRFVKENWKTERTFFLAGKPFLSIYSNPNPS